MGNLSSFCPCAENKNQNIYMNPIQTTTQNQETTYQQQVSRTSADQILNSQTPLPSNIIDIKIGKKDLIKKRNENPYDHYTKVEELGSGSFGIVYKVVNKASNITRALKEIPKKYISNGINENEVANEINILRYLDHPNIIRVYEFFEDEENFYIVTEYCDQGDLGNKIGEGTLPEFIVKYFMKQVFESIAYLHSKNVIHGDIKRENILLCSKTGAKKDIMESIKSIKKDKEVQNELTTFKKKYSMKTESLIKELSDYEAKLADFGCAKMFHKSKLQGIIGTTYYCSPEVLRNEYREECDEWSCGVLMYLLLSGVNPFDGDDEEEIMKSIQNDPVNLKIPRLKHVSFDCKTLIAQLLKKDPTERITAANALKSDFFKDLNQVEESINQNKPDMKVFGNLRRSTSNTGTKSKFKETVIAYISLNFVQKDEEERIKEIFKKLSDDHSTYKIDEEQFVKCILESNTSIKEEEAREMFRDIDSDQNGTIEYQELINALSDKTKLLNESNLKEAFDFFDKDKSGTISWGEINEIISGGKSQSKKLMNEFLQQIGKNANEEISFKEFCKIVRE